MAKKESLNVELVIEVSANVIEAAAKRVLKRNGFDPAAWVPLHPTFPFHIRFVSPEARERQDQIRGELGF